MLLLDGFTGFTPVQMNVIRELLAVCDQVLVTVTMDVKENPLQMGKPHQLFYMSRKMIHTLSGLTNDLDDPVYLKEEKKGRFSDAPALGFLEQLSVPTTEKQHYGNPRMKSVFRRQNPHPKTWKKRQGSNPSRNRSGKRI